VQGRLITGGGYAGELGHVDVGHGEACSCGGRGCVEALASAAAIARRYAAASGRPVAGAREVAELMVAGDPTARRIWKDATGALALALAWTSVVLAPQAILIGGGLARSGSLLFEPLAEALDHHLGVIRRPRLVPATLQDDAGFLGAALLAWEALGEAVQPCSRKS
jgi:glucokinase